MNPSRVVDAALTLAGTLPARGAERVAYDPAAVLDDGGKSWCGGRWEEGVDQTIRVAGRSGREITSLRRMLSSEFAIGDSRRSWKLSVH